LEDTNEKFLLLRLEEAIGIEAQRIEALLCEAFARCEAGRVHWQWWKREEGVFRDATDVAEVFRQGGGDWSNFVGHLLVCEGVGGGVGWWKRRMRLRRQPGVLRAAASKGR
jgi:hypothetical protein